LRQPCRALVRPSAAQANGIRFRRKPTLTPYQRAEAQRKRAGVTLTDIAQLFGVSHMTIQLAVRAWALQISKTAVIAQIRADGRKLSNTPALKLAK
jgi:hypothetical protein